MEPTELTWKQLTDADADGESMLSRWAAGSLDEADERAVNLHLIGSTWARDEAQAYLAVHHGVRALVADRSPVAHGLKIAVRAALGMLEVLEGSLRPMQAAGVQTRTGEFRRPTSHSFDLSALHPGVRLHVTTRGGRFSLDLEHPSSSVDDAEWALAGPGGNLVATDGEDASFPSVVPGTWVLERRAEGQSTPVELQLLLQ